MTTKEVYQEPTGDHMAGHREYKPLPSAYEIFMDEQNLPVYRDIGAYDLRQLPLAPWERMGGRGTFLELDGQLWGMYLVEVPAGGVLNAERHIYEETFIIIEGRGSTEIWREGSSKKQAFEWQPGSHFAIPVNLHHRLVNAASSPALVLVTTTAPMTMNLFQSRSFIFDNANQFPDRYDESEDYFKPREELEPHPDQGRAMLDSNLIPDIIHCYLPLDNNRAPGFRWISPRMGGNAYFQGFLASYPSGRYSKAHYHAASMILYCVAGKGYTYNWPVELGPRPWESGKGHLVKRQDYIGGGIVAAAPGADNWFHQHFSVGKEPLRIRALGTTGNLYSRKRGAGNAGNPSVGVEIGEGGRAIGYPEEDPMIRKVYQEDLKKEGVELDMPESIYKR
ncbi:cupin domain-containing protein [Chloroflexota bacterium]